MNRRGLTFTEMLVYVILFAIFLGLISGIFTWMRHSQSSVRRLDIFHQLRVSSFQISDQLAYAPAIIFPRADPGGRAWNQIIFRNQANEVIALFLNRKNQLVQLNWTNHCLNREPVFTVLTEDTIRFRVKRPAESYVEFDLRMKEGKDEKAREFSLTNSVRLRNVIR